MRPVAADAAEPWTFRLELSAPRDGIRTLSGSLVRGEERMGVREPDLVIARCKTLLASRVFSIPPLGTYVMHPGICPEYRNAGLHPVAQLVPQSPYIIEACDVD